MAQGIEPPSYLATISPNLVDDRFWDGFEFPFPGSAWETRSYDMYESSQLAPNTILPPDQLNLWGSSTLEVPNLTPVLPTVSRKCSETDRSIDVSFNIPSRESSLDSSNQSFVRSESKSQPKSKIQKDKREAKQEKRRQQNRRAQQAYRMRNHQHLIEVEQELEKLRQAHEQLRDEHKALQREMSTMKTP